MDKEMKDLAINLLEEWAASVPDKNAPVLYMGRDYTANEFVDEIKNEGPIGKMFLDLMERSANEQNVPLEQYLRKQILPRQSTRPVRPPKAKPPIKPPAQK